MTPQPEVGMGEMEPLQSPDLPALNMAKLDKPVIPQSPQVRDQEADRDTCVVYRFTLDFGPDVVWCYR